MTNDKEIVSATNGLGALGVRGYDIAGNKIRAFFDDADNLVFVIDDTITPDKPNVLLVIDSFDGRKWDDILANDYGVTLEAVRPKKDNKYQKLDIEYTGLDEYDDLIHSFDSGDDLTNVLGALNAFRRAAARRAAMERLDSAETAAENARETIQRAQESIAELQVRLKTLRSKLAQQKKSVGREPTKQSAAKILRTESQIDALKDKSLRAQRRLDNARRRLVAATDDAEIARNILDRHSDDDDAVASLPVAAAANVPAVAKQAAVAVVSDEVNLPVATEEDDDTVFNKNTEQKAEKMADEEVKPLFDKDPEILDEEIAFKPIDFGIKDVSEPSAVPRINETPRFDDYSDTVAPAPLSFSPPSDETSGRAAPADVSRTSSVLDTITSVEMPSESIERPVANPGPVEAAPAQTPDYNGYSPAPVAPQSRPMPVSPTVPGAAAAAAAPVRPVSPVTGMPAAPVSGGSSGGRKPALLYYVLLIALIALSIFTLWLYQSKNSDTVPDLQATAQTEKSEAAAAPSPFIETETQVATVTEQPEPQPAQPQESVEQPAPAPAPTPVQEPAPQPQPVAPVIDDTIPAIPVVPEPADTAQPELPVETPFITEPEPEPEPVKPVVVNKPAYNAGSQNENMFVADEDYDTDVAPVAAPAPVEAEYQETVEVQSGPVCDDGTTPTGDGCCGDELYTDIGGGSYACCSESTGDCYPPLF